MGNPNRLLEFFDLKNETIGVNIAPDGYI